MTRIRRRLLPVSALLLLLPAASMSACSSGGPPSSTSPDAGPPADFSCEGRTATTLTFQVGDEDAIQDAVNQLAECTTVKLAGGTYRFTNAITIRQKGITLAGAGKGAKGEATGGEASTVLDFSGAAPNANGVDVVGDLFAIHDLTIWNAKKDGLRIETSKNVKIQKVRAEWSAENSKENGAYGLYPVKSTNVLMEDSEAYNAADAGIYVGQTQHTIVRNNVAKQNVAGIEIENTRFADVSGNRAEDNTTGLVVFDLPGNPLKGTDIALHDNVIVHNNRPNFAAVAASSSTVSQVPAGTGTFIMASRRVDVTGNTYEDNDTVDVAVLSGLAIESRPAQWVAGGFNWGISDVWIHGNTMKGGSGDEVDAGHVDATLRPLGAAAAALYAYAAETAGVHAIESMLWDGIDLSTADNALDDVNLCFAGNTLPEGTTNAIVDLKLAGAQPLLTKDPPDIAGAWAKTFHYAQGVAPFNCAGFAPALAPVTLP
jgi:parallel beta-helix repeat protein